MDRSCPCILGVVLALAVGCRAPESSEEEHGSLAELSEMMTGATPVQATQVAGEEPLEESDPYALAPVEAIVQTQAQTPAPAPASPPLQEPEPTTELRVRQDPFIRFGERIIVRDDGAGHSFITKPYTLPSGKAAKLIQLMATLEPFPFRPHPVAPPEEPAAVLPPLDPGVLEYATLEGWDVESYANLRLPLPSDTGIGSPPPEAKAVVLSDLLVVTATYELLEQFEDFLELFAAAGIPQVELEAKIIEVVETDTLDYGVTSAGKTFTFGESNFVQGLDFDLPNISDGIGVLLDLGAVTNSFTFDAVLEAVRTWDNVQIDSRPKTVVRAGGVAYLESTTEIPYFEIKSLDTAGNFSTNTVYKKVGVQLYISPRVIGTKTLALDVHLIGSQQVGSQGTFSVGSGTEQGTVIEVPVIAYRTAKTLVYLEPGQTLVIGGLTTQRERELVNKVPILGDLPLLGYLFRSKFKRTDKQHVLFAISPRILQHSDFETEF